MTGYKNGRPASRPFFLIVFALLLLAQPVSAHRGHGCWTEMTWTGDRFEIVHRMHLSDAINVLRRIEKDTAIDSLRGRAKLALYVEEKFSIAIDGRPVSGVETLGAEIDDDFLLVYQEWLTSLPQTQPEIANRALMEYEHGVEHYLRYDDGTGAGDAQLITPHSH